MLIGEARAANVVGIDPHKLTLSAAVVDPRGGIVAGEHFRVSGEGHRALEAWALSFGPVARWGIENASGWGRHTAVFLAGRDRDVRDVCPNRTPRSDRGRQRGKSDALDAERIARETLAHPLLPRAFKRGATGPDEQTELLVLWHKAHRSLVKSRQRSPVLRPDRRACCPAMSEQPPSGGPCAALPRQPAARAAAVPTRPRCRRAPRPATSPIGVEDRRLRGRGDGRRCRGDARPRSRRWRGRVASAA